VPCVDGESKTAGFDETRLRFRGPGKIQTVVTNHLQKARS